MRRPSNTTLLTSAVRDRVIILAACPHVVLPNLVVFIGPIDANPRHDLFFVVHFCTLSPTSPEKLAFLIAESSKDNI